MSRPRSVRTLLRALASGEGVDWPASIDSAKPDGAAHSLLEALQLVDRIRRTHRRLGEAGTRAPAALPPGSRWGTMRRLEIIGRGAHGLVYRAHDERLNREVAVKLVGAGAPGRGVGRFLDEARLLARVRHPNVVTIHGRRVRRPARPLDGAARWRDPSRDRHERRAAAARRGCRRGRRGLPRPRCGAPGRRAAPRSQAAKCHARGRRARGAHRLQHQRLGGR